MIRQTIQMFVYVLYKLYFCIIHDHDVIVVSTSSDCSYLDILEFDSIKVVGSNTLL